MNAPPSERFASAAAGWYHGLGIRPDGTLVGWGHSTAGQAAPPAGQYVDVSCGAYHSYALTPQPAGVLLFLAGALIVTTRRERGM